MSEVYTFTTKCDKFVISVKPEFLKECNKPEEIDLFLLLTKHKIVQHFHNPSAPALCRKKDNYQEYWIDGKKLDEKDAKLIEHNYKFNDKLMNTINE